MSAFNKLATALLLSLYAAWVNAQSQLVVGTHAGYKPVVFKQQAKLVGIEPSNAQQVAKLLGRELVLKELPWQTLIPALERGEIDVIMAGMTITERRAQQVSFTHPIMQVGQMAIIHSNKLERLSLPTSIFLPGLRVIVEAGSSGESYARDALPEALISTVTTQQQAFKALREDQADMYIHDAPTSWRLAQSSANDDLLALYRPLTQEQLAWAVKKDNTELLKALNEALAEMRRNGSLQAIQDRFIPVKIKVGP